MFRKIINILIIILFNKFINSKHVYYSEPDLSNPYIPKELLESCGYRYRVLHYNIGHNKNCFSNNTYGDRVITVPQTEFLKRSLGRGITNRVLSGRNVQFREAPWVVQLVKKRFTFWITDEYEHWCTGVLLTMKYILTAAHCLDNKRIIWIYVGRDETTEGFRSNDFTFHIHPDYIIGKHPNGTQRVNNEFDIGLIELKTSIDWQKYGTGSGEEYLINTICLPIPENFRESKFEKMYTNYTKATTFGWGSIRGQEMPRVFQRGDLNVRYTQGFFNSLMKFMSEVEENETTQQNLQQRVCEGDSGSGLIQYIDEYESRAVLIGIIIGYVPKLGPKPNPCDRTHMGEAIALRVVQYIDWINDRLKQN